MRAIRDWCEEQLSHPVLLEALPGDAGMRRYYRLTSGRGGMLAVSAPPESEKNEQWRAVQALLMQAGVRVPEVYAMDLERGFWLVEDLGDVLLYGLLRSCSDMEADAWYHRCIEVLWRIQGIRGTVETRSLPSHDATALIEELHLFHDWFVDRLLNMSPSTQYLRDWDDLCACLHTAFEDMPQVLEHGDYQSRNFLVTADDTLAVIDFQDAAWGSPAYDLVSLFKDCYLRWERERVCVWVNDYLQGAHERDLLPSAIDKERFLCHFDFVGLQRHLRVLGTFARLHLRDHKSTYLEHIPRIMDYVDECLSYYSDLDVFSDYWRAVRLCAARTPWMRVHSS